MKKARRQIEYPIVVDGIVFDKTESIRKDGLCEVGSLVAIRPCKEEYGNKTYLGMYIGEVARRKFAKYNSETKELTFGVGMYIPAIYVFELKKIIYGSESWWREVSDISEIKEITDGEIDDLVYVRLLEFFARRKNDGENK